MWKAFMQQLCARATIRTALVVGTLINLYGQVLVPLLRGTDDVVATFSQELREAPLLALVSIGLGFAFPWIVSAYSSARVRVDAGDAAVQSDR